MGRSNAPGRPRNDPRDRTPEGIGESTHLTGSNLECPPLSPKALLLRDLDSVPMTRAWLLLLTIVACIGTLLLLSNCAVSTPFRGPGFNDARGVSSEHLGHSVVVALTHAVLTGDRSTFDEQSRQVADSMESHEGLIAYSVRKQLLGNERWTMTVWTDEEALARFVQSRVHRRAIEQGMPALGNTRFHHFQIPASELPLSWSRALAILEDQGPMEKSKAPTADSPSGKL